METERHRNTRICFGCREPIYDFERQYCVWVNGEIYHSRKCFLMRRRRNAAKKREEEKEKAKQTQLPRFNWMDTG